MAVAACALLAAGSASAGAVASSGPHPFVPGEVVVRYQPGTTGEARAEARAEVRAELQRRLPIPGAELLTLERGQSVARAIAALKRRPEVAYAERNYLYEPQVVPNDPSFGQLWGLHNTGQSILGRTGTPDADIDAPDAWETATGISDVVVGVADTGVALDHPDLAGNLWANPGESGEGRETNGVDDDGNGFVDDLRGWDWVGSDFQLSPPGGNDPSDGNGHGTHVAGTIGAVGDNGTGVAGVNWSVSIMPLRVCGLNGCKSTDIAAAFAYAGANGAGVVNASLSGPGFSTVVANAISASPNTLFVVAAGNEGANNDADPQYPCNYPNANLICVAATDNRDALAGFSGFGTTSVDLAAPGVRVTSTYAFEVPDLLKQGFETTTLPAGWISGGAINTWATTTERRKSGNRSLTDSPGTSYLPDTNSFVRAPAVDLTDASGCRLSYWLRLRVPDPGDALHVEVGNGGEFTPLASWSGSSPNGTAVAHDLSAHEGQSAVRVRFRLSSDGDETTGDGAHIDDLELRCASSGYAYLNGTSMATPHVAGVAALLLDHFPDASVGELRNRILGSVDALPALADVVATGGRLNAAHALAHDGSGPGDGGADPFGEDQGSDVEDPPTGTVAPTSRPKFCPALRRKLRRTRISWRRARALGYRLKARTARHRFLKVRKRYLGYCRPRR